MNLQPRRAHERITVLLIPFDQYSVFPAALDNLYKESAPYPIDVVVIEGNAPDSVREEIEKRKKRHKDLKIIYSNHKPRMAEAFNLGIPHIRTPYAFFMHNNIRVSPGWLSSLMGTAKKKAGVICPFVSYAGADDILNGLIAYPAAREQSREKEASEVDMHGFLATREILKACEGFDEAVSTPLTGVDFGMRLHAAGIPLHRDPYTVLEYAPAALFKPADMKLFMHQWDDDHTRTSLSYLKERWGIVLDEKKYLDWLARKKAACQKKPSFKMPVFEPAPLRMAYPKISFKKFIDVLNRA